MPTPVYVTVRLSRLNVDALYADDLTGHARVLFHMLILLTIVLLRAGEADSS